MKKETIHPMTSIKTRHILYTSAVAVTILVLGIMAVVSVNLSTTTLNKAIEEARQEQYPVLYIRELLQNVRMEFHDYLMQLGTDQRERCLDLDRQIVRAFKDLLSAPFEFSDEAALARDAFHEWEQVQVLLREELSNPDRETVLKLMEEFDARTEQVAETLTQLLNQISTGIDARLVEAYAVRMRLVFAVALVFLLCLSVVVLLGMITTRAILVPIEDLSEGVARIGKGDLSHRVPVRVRNELGMLSRSFNSMAEKLEQDAVEIERLSVREGLTGLYNRRAFESMLMDEINLSKRGRQPFSVIRLNVLDFESLRRSCPEETAHNILHIISYNLLNNIRITDAASHFGDGNFALLLRETTPSGSASMADRLRRALESIDLSPCTSERPSIRVVMGLAAFSESDAEPGTIIRKAEDGMNGIS